MDLIEYLKANYTDVRVIGVINPSIIITHNEITYTIYRAVSQKNGKYVICKGQERVCFDSFSLIKKFIK